MENIICPKVSVIVPVYNAEKYIERCCVSLFEQTLQEMEFIFVDDCSPDRSVDIINEVASRYPNRVGQYKILTHTPNRGVSFSRQQGLDAAIGEFVIHCDSDDWVDIDMYQRMYDTAIKEDADEVCCGFVVEYFDGKKHRVALDEEKLCDKISFNLAPQTGSLVNKIVRLKNLRDANVHFPTDTNWGEDFCVSIAGLLLSRKTVCLPDCFYHYWQNTNSITHTVSRERCLELIRVPNHVEKFLLQIGKYEKYQDELDYLKFQCKSRFLRDKSVRDIVFWEEIFPECHSNILSFPCSMYFKFASWFIVHHLTWVAIIILKLRDSKK